MDSRRFDQQAPQQAHQGQDHNNWLTKPSRSWPMEDMLKRPSQEWKLPERQRQLSAPIGSQTAWDDDPFASSTFPTFPIDRTLPNPLHQCMICLEDVSLDDLPYKCLMCTSKHICADCLKEWFIDACNNETMMPPKCCYAIPVSCVSKLLTQAQIDLYKAKYNEWTTPDRLYCPRPSCSDFISSRLYAYESALSERSNSVSGENNNVHPTSGGSPRSINSQLSFNYTTSPVGSPPSLLERVSAAGAFRPSVSQQESAPSKNPCVTCPECSTLICTNCHSFRHDEECPKMDLDPEFGDEPSHIWSCDHQFFKAWFPTEGQNTSRTLRCEGCSQEAKTRESPEFGQERRGNDSENDADDEDDEDDEDNENCIAWECMECRMIICGDCKNGR